MARFRIDCITKNDRQSPYERITSVGGVFPNGEPWKISQETAIALIDSGTNTYFVHRDGKIVEVITATSRFGHNYLKTVADNDIPDNLLSLPECP